MPDKNEERRRNLVCVLLAFGADTQNAEHLFREFTKGPVFDEISAAYLAGGGFSPQTVFENVKTVSAAIPDADGRALAILSSADNAESVLERCDILAKRFQKEIYHTPPILSLAIIARFMQRGLSPVVYQYKMFKGQMEKFDEITTAILSTTGDVGGTLEKYHLISAMDAAIPMQAKAVLTAVPKPYGEINHCYKFIMKQQADREVIGKATFDHMAAAIMSVAPEPAKMLYRYGKFHSAGLWE